MRFLSFSIIAIFIGIPSGSLCGGESRTGVLQKLFNIRFSYKHCLRLPSYSSRWLPKPGQGLSVFTVMQSPGENLRCAIISFFLLLFPFHFYRVQLVQPTTTPPPPPPPPPHFYRFQNQHLHIWLPSTRRATFLLFGSTNTTTKCLFPFPPPPPPPHFYCFSLFCVSLYCIFFNSPLKPYYIELSTLHQWSETWGKKFNTKCKHLCIT